MVLLLLLFSFNLFSQIALPTFYGALRVSNQNQFQGTSATFTNCGKTGKFGPSQVDCNSEYSGTNLDGFVTVSGGIQEWEVPVTGTYIITAYGAQGGGFGGGGGTARCAGNTYTGGGGGGYSGGGMDYPYQNGTPGGAGGAGSKNNGSNATNVSGNNPGHGKVEISW